MATKKENMITRPKFNVGDIVQIRFWKTGTTWGDWQPGRKEVVNVQLVKGEYMYDVKAPDIEPGVYISSDDGLRLYPSETLVDTCEIRNYPQMEKRLGLDLKYVIIDRVDFNRFNVVGQN